MNQNTSSSWKLFAVGCASAATLVTNSMRVDAAAGSTTTRLVTTASKADASPFAAQVEQPHVLRVLGPLSEVLPTLPDQGVVAQAQMVLARLTEQLSRVNLQRLPPFAINPRDDGSLVIEWGTPGRRLSIALEVDSKDSAWAVAARGDRQAFGHPDSMSTVVDFFLG